MDPPESATAEGYVKPLRDPPIIVGDSVAVGVIIPYKQYSSYTLVILELALVDSVVFTPVNSSVCRHLNQSGVRVFPYEFKTLVKLV